MDLKPINKSGGNFVKPHIKKGYYPAKVISIEPRKTQEGELFEGKYGNQLIIKFAIYNQDDNGNPTTPKVIKTQIEGGTSIEAEVELYKFTYYTYKNQKTGELESAVTPNSAITKLFKALGWEFSESDLKTENFIGKWAEANIDDYEYELEGGEKKKASTIKDINKFEGQVPSGENKSPSKTSTKNNTNAEEEYIDGGADEMQIDEIEISDEDLISDELKKRIKTLQEQVTAGIIEQSTFEEIKKKWIAEEK